MAKIKSESVKGDLGYYEYELHYLVKKNAFIARFPSQQLENLAPQYPLQANTPDDVKELFRKLVKAYELSLNTTWKLWILYRFDGVAFDQTRIEHHSRSRQRNELEFDYICVYYTADDSHYVTRDAWNNAINHYQGKQSPNRTGGYFEVSGRHTDMRRIEHTPELEAFFESISQGMKSLFGKMQGVLSSKNLMIELATNQQLLLT